MGTSVTCGGSLPESSGDDFPFPGLGRRMVYFEDTGLVDSGGSMGSTIKTGAKDDDLVHAPAERFPE